MPLTDRSRTAHLPAFFVSAPAEVSSANESLRRPICLFGARIGQFLLALTLPLPFSRGPDGGIERACGVRA